jgi:hypothetical protein
VDAAEHATLTVTGVAHAAGVMVSVLGVATAYWLSPATETTTSLRGCEVSATV